MGKMCTVSRVFQHSEGAHSPANETGKSKKDIGKKKKKSKRSTFDDHRGVVQNFSAKGRLRRSSKTLKNLCDRKKGVGRVRLMAKTFFGQKEVREKK